MNTEELAKVAEIIGGLGDNAESGLFAYLGFSLVSNLIGSSVCIIAIVALYKAVTYIVRNVRNVNNAYGSERALKKLRVILKVGAPGELTGMEIEQILVKSRKLMEKKG